MGPESDLDLVSESSKSSMMTLGVVPVAGVNSSTVLLEDAALTSANFLMETTG